MKINFLTYCDLLAPEKAYGGWVTIVFSHKKDVQSILDFFKELNGGGRELSTF